MKHLPIDPSTFPFYSREKERGKVLANRCGRDFLYYALCFYYPQEFGAGKLTPLEIDAQKLFGIPLPASLAWLQIQFWKVPSYLARRGLGFLINKKTIKSFFDFVRSILFSRISVVHAIKFLEQGIDRGHVVGIDIAIGRGGLLDHVMFVYGYDAENFYVFDTVRAPIEYEQTTNDSRLIMKLPKKIVEARWTRFGRIWEVYPLV